MDMIDFIKTSLTLPTEKIPPEILKGEGQPFVWQDLNFLHTEKKTYQATKESLSGLQMGNLKIVLRDGIAGKLEIANSLHKVAHSGANHADFTFNELVQTLEYIGDTLDIDFLNAKIIGRFEFGVNIEVDVASEFYEMAHAYRTCKSMPMHSNGKKYGANFHLSNYAVKIYSPYQKVILKDRMKPAFQENIIRFEIAANSCYLRQRKVNLNTVKDLTNIKNLLTLGKILKDISKQINFVPMMPIGLNMQDAEIWLLFKCVTETQLKHFRKRQPKTYYRHKERFEEMLKKCDTNTDFFSSAIEEKWTELLNN